MELMQLKMVNTTMERVLNKRCKAYDLTGTQAAVLSFLFSNKENKIICQRDIEKALGLTHPTVCSILKRLETKELISTKSLIEDHRYNEVLLTPKSKKLKNKLNKEVDSIIQEAFNGISEKDQKLVAKTLTKMNDNLKDLL